MDGESCVKLDLGSYNSTITSICIRIPNMNFTSEQVFNFYNNAHIYPPINSNVWWVKTGSNLSGSVVDGNRLICNLAAPEEEAEEE